MCFATFFAPSLFTNLDGWLIHSLVLWSRILVSPQLLELSLTGLPGPSIGTVKVLFLPDGGVWLMKQDTVHFLPTAGLTILLDSHCIPWGPNFHQMSCPFPDGLFSSFLYHTTHGDRPTMPTTRRRCPLNVTKTMFLEHAPITDFPVNLQLHSQITMIFSRKRRSIL